MQLHIQGPKAKSNRHLHQLTERSVKFAIGRFDDSVARVSVSYKTLHNSKGPANRSCTMIVRLYSGSEIIIDERGFDYESAVNLCADRTKRAVARALDRRRNNPKRRSRLRKLADTETLLPDLEMEPERETPEFF